MKKGITVLVLMMVTAGLAFAAGDGEDDWNDRFRDNFEDVTLTGTIDFTALGTTLTTGGDRWVLLYPRQALAYVEIDEGDVVTVRGLKVSEFRFRNTIGDENYLKVISAEIDGTTYDLFDDRYEDYDDWREGFADRRGGFGGFPEDCWQRSGGRHHGPGKFGGYW